MKKYQIIYADPPWSFGNRMYSSNKNNHHREISRAYKAMTTEDICSIGIARIINKDCILFMWTTDAHVPDALRVIERWGFEYKTVAFYWLKKEKSGKQVCYMGQWTMKNIEMCLLATRGRMTQYLKSRKVRQLVEAPRDRLKHSEKPQEVRNRIVKMFGDLPRIELFARGNKTKDLLGYNQFDGWDVWGNEVDSDIEL